MIDNHDERPDETRLTNDRRRCASCPSACMTHDDILQASNDLFLSHPFPSESSTATMSSAQSAKDRTLIAVIGDEVSPLSRHLSRAADIRLKRIPSQASSSPGSDTSTSNPRRTFSQSTPVSSASPWMGVVWADEGNRDTNDGDRCCLSGIHGTA